MAKVTARIGQTLKDIALMHLGSMEGLGELAKLNRLDLTTVLTAGQVLELPAVYNKRVVKVYSEKGYVPATNPDLTNEGIGNWGIEIDFIVS